MAALRAGLNMVLPEYVPHLKAADHHAAAVQALAARNAPGVARVIRDDIVEACRYIHGLLV